MIRQNDCKTCNDPTRRAGEFRCPRCLDSLVTDLEKENEGLRMLVANAPRERVLRPGMHLRSGEAPAVMTAEEREVIEAAKATVLAWSVSGTNRASRLVRAVGALPRPLRPLTDRLRLAAYCTEAAPSVMGGKGPLVDMLREAADELERLGAK